MYWKKLVGSAVTISAAVLSPMPRRVWYSSLPASAVCPIAQPAASSAEAGRRILRQYKANGSRGSYLQEVRPPPSHCPCPGYRHKEPARIDTAFSALLPKTLVAFVVGCGVILLAVPPHRPGRQLARYAHPVYRFGSDDLMVMQEPIATLHRSFLTSAAGGPSSDRVARSLHRLAL